MKALKRYAFYNKIINRFNFIRMRFICKPFVKVVFWNPEKTGTSNYNDLIVKEEIENCSWSTKLELCVWITPIHKITEMCENEYSDTCYQSIKSTWLPWKLNKYK